MMTVCTFNARTLASEASIEDLMMQARKIRYDVIGLTETRRHRPLNATFDTGEELFLGTCDSKGVGGIGVLVNTNLVMNIDSFEQLTTRIGRLRRTPEELHIGTHGLQSNEQGERLSEFIMTTKTIHGEKAAKFKKRRPKSVITWETRHLFTSLAGFWKDAVVDNIDEEYDWLVQHLRDSAKSAEGLRVTKRRLSYETLKLIRQRGAARAADDYQLTSELAKQCREAIKEDLKERRAAVLAEAAEAGKSIRCARRDFANRKTK
ncbi:hypothetical protein ANCCAN_14698, partial [Ancylostoma caninum]